MARAETIARLKEYYERSGYTRSVPEPDRPTVGHRGYEIRFGAHSPGERDEIVSLLRELGYNPGRPFPKRSNWRIAVYGREETSRLCSLLGVPMVSRVEAPSTAAPRA